MDLATVIVPELCDVADRASIGRVLKRYRPETLFHAAAYKHVPLVESNPVAGLRNNVMGTLNTVLAAEESGVGHFILVSTDTAVRPTNVMGASKRICALIRSEEHTSELQSLMRSSYAVFCLKKKTKARND